MKKISAFFRSKLVMGATALLLTTTAVAQVDVLVCGACSPQTWLDDVQNKLIATSAFNSVTTYNTYLTGTPTLAYLQTFDAVLVYTDYGAQDPVTLGNNLAAYIDGGGAVVSATFTNASVLVTGNFNTAAYQVCIPSGGQNSSPQLTLGTINNACSGIMNGITTFDGGSSSYRSSSSSFTPGSTVEANWSNGEWLVATRTNVGPANVRRADLNFYPPSSDVRSDFWSSSTQGGQLMANALLWCCGVLNNSSAPGQPGTITGSASVCNGSNSVTYSIGPVATATSYTWSVPAGATIVSGQGTTSITVNFGSTSGNISVYASNLCDGPVQTLAVTVNPLPTIGSTATPGNTVCQGSNVTFNGTGGSTYAWSGGVNDGVPFTAMTSGTYTVTGTDANGCSNTATANLTVNPLPTVNLGQDVTQCGGNVTLDAQNAGASYLWSTTATTQTINVSNSGTYYVGVMNANGCVNGDTILVTINALPVVDLGADYSACDMTTLDAGNPGSTYLWNTTSPQQQIAVSTSGQYYVDVTDTNGCTSSDTINVTINASPNVAANASALSSCEDGGPITLSATPVGGTWSGPGVTGNTFDPTVGGGAYMPTYSITDANGCSGSAWVNITVYSLPVLQASSSASNVCMDDANVMLLGTPSGGSWSGSSVTGNQFDPSIGSGTYTMTYSYTDSHGCSNTQTTNITVNACTGVAEQSANNGINVYPNPNSGSFAISFAAETGDVTIEVIDMSGRVVYAAMENNVAAGAVKQVSLENANAGMYLLRVISANGQAMSKISVQ